MIALDGKWPRLIATLLAAHLAWLAIGIFPVAPLEGDEQGVINGATAMSRGEPDYFGLSYLPEIQPGSYALLSGASRTSGIPVETIFAVGTVIGAALFAWFAAILLALLLGLPRWVALVGLLWNQEIFSAAYYLNTTALGMWLTLVALLIACRPPTWRTGTAIMLCLAVAGWIRIDCLLPAPAIPVLLYLASKDLRRSSRFTALIAIGSLILVGTLYRCSGITWTNLSSTYAGRGGIEGWWATIRFLPLLLSPLVCLISLGGTVLLVTRRQWRLLILVVAGCVATLPIYGTSLSTTKYFYHLVPFMLIPAFFAGRQILDWMARLSAAWRKRLAVVFSLAAIADQTVALQTSSPEFRRYAAEPILTDLVSLRGHSRLAHLVIGAGEIIPTADGFRLRGGAWFAPWVWHREKKAMLAQLSHLDTICRNSPHVTIYYSGWLPYQMAVRTLRLGGYSFQDRPTSNSMSFTGNWTQAERQVRIQYLPYRTSPFFDPSYHPENLTGQQTYFIGDLSGIQPITELSDAGEWTPLASEYLWNFITIYRRRLASSLP